MATTTHQDTRDASFPVDCAGLHAHNRFAREPEKSQQQSRFIEFDASERTICQVTSQQSHRIHQ